MKNTPKTYEEKEQDHNHKTITNNKKTEQKRNTNSKN